MISRDVSFRVVIHDDKGVAPEDNCFAACLVKVPHFPKDQSLDSGEGDFQGYALATCALNNEEWGFIRHSTILRDMIADALLNSQSEIGVWQWVSLKSRVL